MSRDDWKAYIGEYERSAGRSLFEKLFLKTVLAHIDELEPLNVHDEHPFKDVDGGNRRIDFAIIEGSHVRIAIEVDGYDKRNTGTGMTSREFADWSKREVSLTALGYRVLRFANTYVRDEPAQCIQVVRTVVKRERAVAAERDAASAAHRTFTTEERDRVWDAALTQAEKSVLADAVQVNAARFAEIEAELAAAQKLATAATEQAEIATQDADAATKRADAATERASAATNQANVAANQALTYKGEIAEHEQRWNSMGKILAAFAVFGIAALIVVAVVSNGADNGADSVPLLTNGMNSVPTFTDGNSPIPQTTDGSSAAAGPCAGAISWREAGSHVGETLAVEGRVVGTKYDSTGSKNTYLNVGNDYPKTDRFQVVIFADDRNNFERRPENEFRDTVICAVGRISEYQGVPQIVADDPGDINVQ